MPAADRAALAGAGPRLVGPLDAARPCLHHGDDVRFRRRRGARGGDRAAALRGRRAVVLGLDAAGTGPGWRARQRGVPGGQAAADRAGGAPVPGRAGLPARRVHRFPAPGHVQPAAPGPARVRRARPSTRRSSEAAAVLDRWGYRSQARDAEHQLPGVLGQALLINRSPRLEDLTTEAFARLRGASRDRPPAPDDAVRAPAGGRRPRLLRAARPARPQPRARRSRAPTRPGRSWVERWHATSTLTPEGPRDHPHHHGQGRALAGRRAPARSPSPGSGPGRPARPGSRPSTGWRSATTSSARDALARPRREAGLPRAPRPTTSWPPARSSATARNGSGSPAGSTPPARWRVPRSVSALIGTDPRVIADDVWAKLLWAGLNLEAADLPGTVRRQLLPDRADPRDHPDLAVLRPAQRRDRPAAGRLHPLAARRAAHPGRLPRDPRRRRRLPARRPRPQDRHRVHQARRPDRRPGHRGMAGAAARPAARELDRKTGEQVDLLFSVRAHPVAKALHQPHDHPGAVRQGRRPRRRRPRQHHQPPGPLHDRQPALQRQGADDAVRAAGLARAPHADHHPALREDHPEHADQGLHRRRVLRPQRPHHRGPPRPRRRHLRRRRRPASPGSTTTSATATAPTPSSSSARTAWPAPAATSTPPRTPARPSCSKPRTTCSGCSPSIPLTDDERAAVEDGQAALDKLLARLADVATPSGTTPRETRRATRRDQPADRRNHASQTRIKPDI